MTETTALAQFDIIVLGGGIVGLTVANLCADHNFRVAVVEKHSPELNWTPDKFDIRCSAISEGSRRIFEKIDVWQNIEETRVSPYRTMLVWDSLGFSEIRFDVAEVGEPELGHIIENRVIIKSLWEKAEKHPNITLMTDKHPHDLRVDNNFVELNLADIGILQAKLIIGADGAHSWLRKTARIETTHRNYHQQALVSIVKTELPHQETAWQRFLPTGPVAFLPLSEPYTSSIVWTITEEKTKELMQLSEQKFCQELAYAFDYRLGKVTSSSQCQAFPLKMIHAKQYVKDRIALIGDALHVIHPLAGQGVNLGLKDAEVLAEFIRDAHQLGSDIGNYLVLRKFERARKTDVATTLLAMEFFKTIFATDLTPLIGLRDLGMNFVDKTACLKKKIIQHAMGI